MDCQALSEARKKWLRQHGLDGVLTIMETPQHWEAEKIVKEINTELITDEANRSLIGLPEGGIFTIENPTLEHLRKYFGEYSLASKAYRTQGGKRYTVSRDCPCAPRIRPHLHAIPLYATEPGRFGDRHL